MKQKIVIKVQMANDISRSKAMAVVAATGGVDSVALAGEGKDQVVVVGEGVDSVKLTSALRKKVGPAQLVQVGEAKQKIVIKVQMANDKSRSKAVALVAATGGVDSVALAGEGKDQVVVVGDVDPVQLTSALRKKVGPAQLVSVGGAKNVEEKRPAIVAVVDYPSQPVAVNAVNEHPATVYGYRQFGELKMVCILGFAGVGKTTLADLLYHAIGEQFQCRAFVSVSPSPNMMEILIAILTEVTNEPYGGATEAAAEQCIIHSISNFLADKRRRSSTDGSS